MALNLGNSYSTSYLNNNLNGRSRQSNRYENLHKNFVTPQQNYIPSSIYNSTNPRKEVNIDDLRVILDKPKSTIQKHKFEGQSLYTDTYTLKQGYNGKQQNYRHQDNLTTGQGLFSGATEYMDNLKGLNPNSKAQRVPLTQNQIFPRGIFQGNSAYTDSYIPSQSKKDPPIRPQDELRVGEGKFQGNSSYLNDYSRLRTISKPQKIIYRDNGVLPKGNFEGDSTYTNAYIQSKMQANPKFVPRPQLQVGGKFQGGSSYLNDFNLKSSPKVQKYKQPDNNAFPKGNFQGESNYQGSYVGYQGQKTMQFRPQQQWKVQGKFQGNSSYQNDYKGHSNGIRTEKITMQNNQIMPEGRFQGNSNYQSNYLPNQAVRQRQFKPQGELRVGEGYFEGNSSYTNDYQGNGTFAQQQKFIPKGNQILPKGRFQGNTVYQSNYIESKGERGQSYKPRHEMEVGGKFQGQSSYNGDYHAKIGIRSERTPLPHNQVFPDGKFAGQSQYTDSYIPTTMTRVQKVTMKPELKVGEGKFEGNSTYTDHHQGYYIKYNNQKINQVENAYNPQYEIPNTLERRNIY